MKRILAFLIALSLMAPLASPGAARERSSVYSVIFAIDVDDQGNITDFKVDMVNDPLSGSTKPLKIAVPAEYVAAARAKVDAGPKAGPARRYFTYFFFDPSRPGTTDVYPGF